MFKRLAIFALLSVSFAFAKTYSFTITDPVHAGKNELKPGDYKVKVEGSQVELLDKKGHRIDAVLKLENNDQKYQQTAVSISTEGGTNRIIAIELGGTRDKIVLE